MSFPNDFSNKVNPFIINDEGSLTSKKDDVDDNVDDNIKRETSTPKSGILSQKGSSVERNVTVIEKENNSVKTEQDVALLVVNNLSIPPTFVDKDKHQPLADYKSVSNQKLSNNAELNATATATSILI